MNGHVPLEPVKEHTVPNFKDWPSLRRFRKRLTSWVDKTCFTGEPEEGVDCAIQFTESFNDPDVYVSIAEEYYPLDEPEYLDAEKR